MFTHSIFYLYLLNKRLCFRKLIVIHLITELKVNISMRLQNCNTVMQLYMLL